MTHFQKALDIYMRVEGISARELQREIGIDHTAVSRFTSGKDISLNNYNILLSWFMGARATE